jgi:hypothetical protein
MALFNSFSSSSMYVALKVPLSMESEVLEGRQYRLQHPWVGIVNRSQADINKNVDMLSARRKEKEYFESSPEYGHLAHKMGAEYLAKLLSQVRAFCCCGMLLTINF